MIDNNATGKPVNGITLTMAIPNAPDMTTEISNEQIVEWFKYVYIISPAAQEPIKWFGWTLQKNPMDMWMYQEIIARCKPDIIIETGTCGGGSALYMAMICDAVGNGQIITIDINKYTNQPSHPRIEYLIGNSVSESIIKYVSLKCVGKDVMVILDSDHSKTHVINELNEYAYLVSKEQYLIVEDTQINGHPVGQKWGLGPWEAVEEWLPHHPKFIIY